VDNIPPTSLHVGKNESSSPVCWPLARSSAEWLTVQ